MGRRNKPEAEKRTNRQETLYSGAEWEILQHNAKWAGLDRSEYTRWKTVEAEPRFKPPPDRIALIDGCSDLRHMRRLLGAIQEKGDFGADTELSVRRMEEMMLLLYEKFIETLDHGSHYRKHKGRS